MLPFLLLSCIRGAPIIGDGPTAASPELAPADTHVVRFLAIGDAGEGNKTQKKVAAAMREFCASKTDERGPGCSFVAYLGDNFYQEGVSGPDDPQWQSKWADVYAGLELPFYVALGNHDYGSPPFDRRRAAAQLKGPPNDLAIDKKLWVQPAPWYGFDAGPVRFVVIDSHAVLMGWTDEEQAGFVQAQLESAKDRPVVVLTHHPFKSNGQHGSAGNYEGSRYIPYASGGRVADFYTAEFCDKTVLMLAGHEHNRQWLEPECGIELVVSGAPAKHTPLIRDGAATLFGDDKSHGFAWFEITGATLHGEFVTEDGVVDFTRSISLVQPGIEKTETTPEALPAAAK